MSIFESFGQCPSIWPTKSYRWCFPTAKSVKFGPPISCFERILRVSFSNHLELDKALRTVLDAILCSFHRPKVHLYYSTKIESLVHSYLQKTNLTMNFHDQSITPEALTTDPKNLSTTSITKLIESVLYSLVMFQSDSEPDESQQAAKRWSNCYSGVRNKPTWV